MTYITTFGNDLFDRYFVGSDRVMKQLNDHLTHSTQHKQNNYPPYNIKKIQHNCYMVEMALAGFSKNDIDIIVEDGKLTVKGKLQISEPTKEDHEQIYLYKGISDRAFTRQFTLADNVEVKKASLENGMLKIWVEAFIPDHKKPKKIEITCD